MKRKITVILAADVAGYSRLVADDEEEAVRRLASYRGVFDELIARYGGRIFNTAGDAVLAEFSSAVDAVRCAVDVQESIRSRNLAYPAARHMSFRIGITIGDVMERDGDLLGEGVNVAARLESVAPPGGICISRSVHEAVVNKLSVRFADQGEQQLKNMPDRVHAYTIVMEEKPRTRRNLFVPLQRWFTGWRGLTAAAVAASALGVGVAHFSEKASPGPGAPRESRETPAAAKRTSTEARAPKVEAPKAEADAARPDAEPDPASVAASPNPVDTAERSTDEAPPAPSADDEKPAPVQPAAAESPPSATPSEPSATPTPARPDPLSEKIVLQRNWTDCSEGTLEQAYTACQPIVDGQLVTGKELAALQLKYGRALREKNEVDKAIDNYTRSIELEPTAEAYNNRGIAYYDKGDWERSIADYTEAIRLDESDGEAYNNRAWTRFQAGDPRMALRDADTAVRLLPRKAYTWDTRAHIHEALGNKSDAIRDFRKAISLDPSSKASSDGLSRLGAAE